MVAASYGADRRANAHRWTNANQRGNADGDTRAAHTNINTGAAHTNKRSADANANARRCTNTNDQSVKHADPHVHPGFNDHACGTD